MTQEPVRMRGAAPCHAGYARWGSLPPSAALGGTLGEKVQSPTAGAMAGGGEREGFFV